MAMKMYEAGSRQWRLALLESDLPQNVKHVGLVVHTYMCGDNGGQEAPWPDQFPTSTEVARLAGFSESVFLRHYRRLKREGWL